jgi:hypothetical protein
MVKRSLAPLIVAVSLLLPMLYVGSYFAMVVPGAAMPYVGGNETAQKVFWPLEQIDRLLRPTKWA